MPADRHDSPECARVRSKLYEFVDNAVTNVEAERARKHFVECADCAAELESIRACERLLATAREVIPPCGDLRPAFYARLAAPYGRSVGIARAWRFGLPFAAAACAALIYFQPKSEVVPNTRPARIAANAQSTTANHKPVVVARRDAEPRGTIADDSDVDRVAPVHYRRRHRHHAVPAARELLARSRAAHPIAVATNTKRNTLSRTAPEQVAELPREDVSLQICDEDRGFIASRSETSNVKDGVIVDTVETKSAAAPAIISVR